jgi:acetyl-CoA carboxylase carboxyl transferase subunit beta
LPVGFQRTEFRREHGTVDLIVDRREMRDRLAALFALMMNQPAPVASDA